MSTVSEAPGTTAMVGDPLRAARRIAPLLNDNAFHGEKRGRLTDQTAAALLDERLFSLKVKPKWGGYGADYLTTVEVIEEVSRADAASGWCLSVCNSNSAVISASLGEDGLAEVFADDARVAIAGALQPRGRSTEVDGGALFSGEFGWASGSSHAQWYLAGAPVEKPGGAFVIRMHVIPIEACRLYDNWCVAGLEATCSQDLSIEDVLVPQSRIFDVELGASSLAAGYAGNGGSGAASESTPRGMSIQESAVLGVAGLAGWALGVGRRALDELEEAGPKAKRLLAPGLIAEDFQIQVGLSHAEGRLRAARARLMSLLGEMVNSSVGEAPEELRVSVFEASLECTVAAREAALFAFDSAPTSVVHRHEPIQRCVRDLLVGLKHAAASTAMQSKIGLARFGSPDHGL